MATQRIFLDSNPSQQFSTVVNGTRVVFNFRYNTQTERFYFDMSANDEFIVQGRTLVGETDVLGGISTIDRQFGVLVELDIDDKGRSPTLENIASGDVRVFMVSS
jgi:hypothetical protein